MLRKYGLTVTLFTMFIVSWMLQAITQWQEYLSKVKDHASDPEFQGFVWEFLAATFENWQSEFLQLFTFVILSTYLIHKGSPQSRDGDDEMKQDIKDIKKHLNMG